MRLPWGYKIELKKDKGAQKAYSTSSSSVYPNYVSTFVNTGIPVWRNLSEANYLLKCYYENPVVNAVLNLLAECDADAEYFVKDLKTEELTPIKKYDQDGGFLQNLIVKPFKSSKEHDISTSLNQNVFGNVYTYATVPKGFEDNFTYKDITSLKNLPTYLIAPKLTGTYLEATSIDEMVSSYVFMYNGKQTTISANQILHISEANLKFDQNYTQGVSKLCALQKPISNIDLAFESRNVMAKSRGALGMITPKITKDEDLAGAQPLKNKEKQEVQEEFKDQYGLLENQYNTLITKYPLEYTKMGFNVKELMLNEEVANSTLAICNSFGLPELLAKNYIAGGTFNNMGESRKRLYEDTVIPKKQMNVAALNDYLKLKDFGIELVASFDHLQVLQENKKKAAETNKINNQTAKEQFFGGLITYEDWAISAGREVDAKMKNVRIFDLETEQIEKLKLVN